MKIRFALWGLAHFLAFPALAANHEKTYVVNVPHVEVDATAISCREITFGHASQPTAALFLPNKKISDSRVLLTSHSNNDAVWQAYQPSGFCNELSKLQELGKIPASVQNKVKFFVVGSLGSPSGLYLDGLHLQETAQLTFQALGKTFYFGFDRGSVSGGSKAVVSEGK